ncbi:MAG: hypothetical protein ACOX0C_02625 [Patescibacteria group bacterium]
MKKMKELVNFIQLKDVITAILAILLAIAIWFLVKGYSRPCPPYPKTWEEEYQAVSAELKNAQKEISNLRVEVEIVSGELKCAQSKLLAAGLPIKCLEAPKKAPEAKKPATPKPPVKKALGNPAPTPTPKQIVEQPVSTPSPRIIDEPANISRVAAPAPVEVSTFDALKEGDGGFRFCVRVNGREDQYFPDYAVRKGKSVMGAEDNGRQGHNLLVVEPTIGYDDPQGGITESGVIYYPVSVVESYLKPQYVDVLYSKRWEALRMKKEGNWYVYDTNQ